MLLKPIGSFILAAAVAMVWSADSGMHPKAQTPRQTPQQAVDELLAADRAASAASAQTTVIPGLTAMFAPDIVMPAPGVGFARGIAAVSDSLRANADNATARLSWMPVRGGISGDGLQGFTFGYMSLVKTDGTTTPLKYLSYWVKREGRWQVVAYKRRLRPAGDVSTTLMVPAMPEALVAPTSDRARLEFNEQSLIAAEQAFSDEAQQIGLRAAFAKFGSTDAMNMGGPNHREFVISAEAISQVVSEGEPTTGSSVSWSADSAIVASSGDLGVTIGYIRPNVAAGAPPPPPIPFFTIWRRAGPTMPWRYIAE